MENRNETSLKPTERVIDIPDGVYKAQCERVSSFWSEHHSTFLLSAGAVGLLGAVGRRVLLDCGGGVGGVPADVVARRRRPFPREAHLLSGCGFGKVQTEFR